MTSDAVLLENYSKTSDAEAFAALVKRHGGLVYCVALRITGNRQDAEDVAQACFLDLARGAEKVTTSVASWLHRSARWRSLSAVRDASTRRIHEKQAWEEKYRGNVDSEWEKIKPRIDEAIGELPEELRTPIILHYLEGRDQAEIAELTGVNQSTVSRRLEQGVEEMRKLLWKDSMTASSAALAGLMTANCIQPVPAELSACLGKMALAGMGAPVQTGAMIGQTAAYGGGVVMKTAIGVALVLAVGATVYVAKKQGAVVPLKAPGRMAVSIVNKSNGGTLLGSAAFVPSPVCSVGWRGDGTGRYPGATPPVTWGVWPKGLYKDLRFSATKPKGSGPEGGRPVTRGIIQDWLVAGPFEAQDLAEAKDKEFLKDEPKLRPEVADKTWQMYRCWIAFSGDGSDIQFGIPYDQIASKYPEDQNIRSNQAAYAFTYLYSPVDGTVPFRLKHSSAIRIWANGEVAYETDRGTGQYDFHKFSMKVKKGWNAVLQKVVSRRGGWHSAMTVQPPDDFTEHETENVIWMVKVPARGLGLPVVANDRVFVCGEYSEAMCFSKTDGKLQWMNTLTFYDAAHDEDRNNEQYKNAAPKAERLRELNAKIVALKNDGAPDDKIKPLRDEKGKLFRELWDIMRAINKERYEGDNNGLNDKSSEGGHSVPTPSTDGKFFYAYNMVGIAACFDVNGKTVWIKHVPSGSSGEHGANFSPLLAGGKYIIGGKEGIALDCKTGEVAWRSKTVRGGHYSMVRTTIGGEEVVISGVANGAVSRVRDGEMISNLGHEFKHTISSPVVGDGAVYIQDQHRFYGAKLAAGGSGQKIFDIDDEKTPARQAKGRYPKTNGCVCSSPLYHDGLLYAADPLGYLIVIDPAEGKVIWEKELDLHPTYGNHTGMYVSPTLGGKYIFVMDDFGTTAVVEPGREPRQIAKNQIWAYQHERWNGEKWHGEFTEHSVPVFDGDSIYIRSATRLFRIGKK